MEKMDSDKAEAQAETAAEPMPPAPPQTQQEPTITLAMPPGIFSHGYSKQNRPLSTQLFVPSRTRNKGNFLCIRLIGSQEAVETGKTLTSDEAVGAWCLECNVPVMWKKGESNGVSRHMKKYHSELLKQAGVDRLSDVHLSSDRPEKRVKTESSLPLLSKGTRNYAGLLSKPYVSNQAAFDALTVAWIHQDMRPFSIVEDQGLRDLISFASTMKGVPELCSSGETVRSSSKVLVSLCDDEILKRIQNDMFCCSISVDTWEPNSSPESSIAFRAVSVHFVTPNFVVESLPLHVSFSNKGDDQSPELLTQVLEKWNLDTSKISVFITNHNLPMTSNKDAEALKQVPCVTSVAHILHTVLYPFCNSDSALQQDYDGDVACYNGKNRNEWASQKHVVMVQEVVSKARRVVNYIAENNSAKEKVNGSKGGDIVPIVPDVRDCWSSTHKMIESVLSNRAGIRSLWDESNSFLGDLPDFSDEDWALLMGFNVLLTPFYSLRESLGLESHPSMIYAFPFLHRVKSILGLADLFQGSESGKVSREKAGNTMKESLDYLLETFGEQSFISSVISTLEASQESMKKEFESYFESLDGNFLWASMLDPRLRKLNHCTDEERIQAKDALVNEMVEMEKSGETQTQRAAAQPRLDEIAKGPSTLVNDMFMDVFDDPGEPSSGDVPGSEAVKEEGRESNDNVAAKSTDTDLSTIDIHTAQQELSRYLLAPNVNQNTSALHWWRVNATQYPILSRLARKWLSIAVSVSPSDRIFSNCGLVKFIAAEISSLKTFQCRPGWESKDFEAQLRLKMKLQGLQLSADDIATMILHDNSFRGQHLPSVQHI